MSNYGRSHYSPTTLAFPTLKIGRIRVIQQIPVCALDSISLAMALKIRMATLRRASVLSPVMTLAAFYTPMRHIYDNWVTFITEGIKEDENLATWTNNSDHNIEFFGQHVPNEHSFATIPAHSFRPYNKIWNRYFRLPTDDHARGALGSEGGLAGAGYGVIGDDDLLADDADTLKYGYPACQLPTVWNSGIHNYSVNESDRDVPTTGNVLDVVALQQIKARYGSLQERAFFAATDRYTDIMKAVYGTKTSHINIDADERSELLSMSDNYLGSQDTPIVDTSSAGKSTGQGYGEMMFGFPKKFFPEHGIITIMAVLRYPQIMTGETNPIMSKANPSYKELANDPRIMGNEPPEVLNPIDWFTQIAAFTSGDWGTVPFGQQFRTLPQGIVDSSYDELDGFPFLDASSLVRARNVFYCDPSSYDKIFQAPNQLGHAQVATENQWSIERLTPEAMDSIFVGANK